MSNEYISKEVEKIITDKSLEFPLNVAMASAWCLGNLKGVNLKILDIKKTSSLSDYFVLASATNFTQAKSMADVVTVQMKSRGFEPISREGMNDADWILIDFGDVIVHIFHEASRDVYDFENLQKDAKNIEIPNSYYYSSEEAEKTSGETEETERTFF